MRLTYLHEIAVSFLETHGYETVLCESEEARARGRFDRGQKLALLFLRAIRLVKSPEEFYLPGDSLDLAR